MPPEDGPAEWRPGCPDCAELREELAIAREIATRNRDLRDDYEAKLREELATAHAELFERYATAVGTATDPPDPMDVYAVPDDTDMTSAEFQATRPKIAPEG